MLTTPWQSTSAPSPDRNQRLESDYSTFQRRFERRGKFAGFVRDVRGKRRMRLQTEEGELLLKAPKELRKKLLPILTAGSEIAVAGVELRDDFSGAVKYVAARIHLLRPAAAQPAACKACPIRICAKKNCWRNGGEQLWKRLERAIENSGLEDAVELKATGCLGNCKRGPNLECADRLHERCSRISPELILSQVVRKVNV